MNSCTKIPLIYQLTTVFSNHTLYYIFRQHIALIAISHAGVYSFLYDSDNHKVYGYRFSWFSLFLYHIEPCSSPSVWKLGINNVMK